MKNDELKQLVSQKMFLIECFLFTGTLKTKNNQDQVLKHGVTNYYLGSIVLELFVKILFELNFKKQAPFTHNALKVFEGLKNPTKSFVRSKYDEARERKVEIFKKIDKTVSFPPLHQVLEANENFIKNFKYNATASKSNTSADAIFYNELIRYINNELAKLNDT